MHLEHLKAKMIVQYCSLLTKLETKGKEHMAIVPISKKGWCCQGGNVNDLILFTTSQKVQEVPRRSLEGLLDRKSFVNASKEKKCSKIVIINHAFHQLLPWILLLH
ncbi:unnamed protein product [Lepeophtheirus salmonis]|uniref:(salmon louse) hypothetical protein n=1 Tax=Lepeophtheirus salmonis TaxID=72036 RepID=A0A7R8CIK9_LEPSM|nr:unnamed protein product [Lepeophtheirus salmonis]CAF2796407.1 unnamed protein product [Lepeophtheirus salmonis]